MSAEAVIVLNPELNISSDLGFIRKQYMQLSSKMRFTSAQFIALLTDELWLENAKHANSMAQRLAAGVKEIPGVTITRPTQANAVFAQLPPASIPRLQAHTPFYVWNEAQSEVRWVCSWDTTETDLEEFTTALKTELN